MAKKIIETTMEISGKPYNIKIFSPDEQQVYKVIIGLVAELYFKKDEKLGWVEIKKNQYTDLAERIGKLIDKKTR